MKRITRPSHAASPALAVRTDVGERDVLALIADHNGAVAEAPAVLSLNEPRIASLARAVGRATQGRQARTGIEKAGHDHRPLLSRLAGTHLR